MARWLFILLLGFGLSGCYYVDQGRGQWRLRFDQVPIAEAIANERDPKIRALLSQVEDIKTFGQQAMGLSPTKNYQGYYRTNQKGITFVVTASPKLQLKAYTWWFPVVGSVPYKGFFDPKDAQALQKKLEAEGFDVYLFAAPAYSSLGWFVDPITTPMLQTGIWGLADTIIHEMAHATLYVNGQGNFNEQLASFVGRQGAELYLRQKAGWSEDQIRQYHQRRTKYRQAQTLIQQSLAGFRELYSRLDLKDDEKQQEKERLFGQLSAELKQLTGRDWELNNARLLQFQRYKADNVLFARTLEKAQGDWAVFWDLIQQHTAAQGW